MNPVSSLVARELSTPLIIFDHEKKAQGASEQNYIEAKSANYYGTKMIINSISIGEINREEVIRRYLEEHMPYKTREMHRTSAILAGIVTAFAMMVFVVAFVGQFFLQSGVPALVAGVALLIAGVSIFAARMLSVQKAT